MDVSTRVQLTGSFYKGINKLIVLFASDTLLAEPEVKIIVQQVFVVRATIEHDGQGTVGMHAGTQCRQNELCHGYQNTTGALITDSKNFLSV